MPESELLKGLNDAQREAVLATEGPVMAIAGAGSGKTKVLTTRISYIIKELGVNPYSILAVTFTNKAANEMKERIGNILGINTKWLWVSTFHSFCVRVLREEANKLDGYTKSFQIIDDDDQAKIIKKVAEEQGFYSKPKDLLKLISKYKNGMAVKTGFRDLQSEFPKALEKYNEYLKENNLFDFDDLILKTIELFVKNPDVLEHYQRRFEYILVDEFQDTNSKQYELIMMLALRHHNLFVVGDDFQSIYSFRGAKIENINRLRKDFLETQLILLEKNYRSTTEILNLANDCIKHNPNQIKKVLTSNNSTGPKPLYYASVRSHEEVGFVVDNIKKRLLDGIKAREIAVLYRSNYLSREFEDAFMKAHIKYKIYGGLSFYSRMEIKDMVAYLRVIANPDDNFSFRRIINVPKRKIGDALINKLDDKAKALGLSLYEAIPYYEGSGQGAKALAEFKVMMDSISASISNVRLPDLIDSVLKETGYESYLDDSDKDSDTVKDRMDNIKEFKSILLEAEDFYEGETNKDKLNALLQDLALRTDKADEDVDDAVRLSTFHQVKGLEFDTVFMVALDEGVFPSMNSVTDEDFEEERRICYVGITRAKQRLFLSSTQSRYRFGKSESFTPSRFIKEVDRNLYDSYNPFKQAIKPVVNIPNDIRATLAKANNSTQTAAPSADFAVGDKLNHKAFGDGMVVSRDGDIITVAFSAPHGIKKISVKFPGMKKIVK